MSNTRAAPLTICAARTLYAAPDVQPQAADWTSQGRHKPRTSRSLAYTTSRLGLARLAYELRMAVGECSLSLQPSAGASDASRVDLPYAHTTSLPTGQAFRNAVRLCREVHYWGQSSVALALGANMGRSAYLTGNADTQAAFSCDSRL